MKFFGIKEKGKKKKEKNAGNARKTSIEEELTRREYMKEWNAEKR